MDGLEKLTPQTWITLLQLLAPGLVIVYFRSLFVAQRHSSSRDNVVLYFIVSSIYALLSWPLSAVLGTFSSTTSGWSLAGWICLLVFAPIAGGIVLGAAAQKGWFRQLYSWINLQPVSPYPTGWDWVFGQMKRETYVIITLDDGVQIAGLFGSNSLAASDPNHRDLYIEEVFDLIGGQWTERSQRQGILIRSDAIRLIEVMKTEGT